MADNVIQSVASFLRRKDPTDVRRILLEKGHRGLTEDQKRELIRQNLSLVMGSTGSSPFKRLPLRQGITLRQVVGNMRKLQPSDLAELEELVDILNRRGGRIIPQPAGNRINQFAQLLGLDPGAGNAPLARSFQQLLRLSDRVPSRSGFNLPNLLRR